MRQTKTTTILLLTLALLCLQANAFSLFEVGSLRKNLIMNAHATSSGIINLKKDSYSSSGFYVEADFSSSRYSSSNSSNSSNTSSGLSASDTVKMMISLANEETIVATNCLSFGYYDCSRYNCYKYSSSSQIDYPTFMVTASTQVQSYIHLDYTYWNKDQSSSSFYMASYCQTGDTSSSIGSGKYGVLGLGAGTSSKVDFTSSAIFSILIDSDLSEGKLLFMEDTSYAQSSSPLYTFYGNSTWQIPNYSGSIKIDGTAVYWKSGNIVFDVNFDAIGVPSDMYTLLKTYFGYTPNVWCNSGIYRPTCYTTEKLEDLPDITLIFNNYQLPIPSAIYATYTSTSGSYTYFSFNFKATGPSMTGKNYVSPTFKDSIILDAHFMSYYYTVFDATDNTHTISLYLSTNAPGNVNFVKWIVIGAAGAIFLIALCFCCAKKKKATAVKNDTSAPINTTTDAFNAAQAGTVYNQQGVNNPAYAYGQANYNYPGYNYPAQPQGVYQPYPAQTQGGMYVPPAQTGQFQERAKQ